MRTRQCESRNPNAASTAATENNPLLPWGIKVTRRPNAKQRNPSQKNVRGNKSNCAMSLCRKEDLPGPLVLGLLINVRSQERDGTHNEQDVSDYRVMARF